MTRKWCDICMESAELVDCFGRVDRDNPPANRYCKKCDTLLTVNWHEEKEKAEVAAMLLEDFPSDPNDGRADEDYENSIYNNW